MSAFPPAMKAPAVGEVSGTCRGPGLVVEIQRGNGTNADRYVMHLMTKLDDLDPPTLDVVLLPDADPDDDHEGVWFDTAEEALQHACAGGGARSDRFVIGGTICDEFLDYLRWNGRAPV
jgi:hypothetical protein